MAVAVCLRARHGADGAPTLAVGRPTEAAAEQAADPAALSALREAWAALSRPAPRGVVGPAARLERQERAVGAAFAALIRSAPQVAHRLSARLGEARAAGGVAALHIDAVEADLRDLPWELLGSLETGQVQATSERGLRVLRLGPGQSEPRRGDRVRMLLWALDPEDPAVARGLRDRRGLAERLGVEVVTVSPPDLRPPPPAPGALDLLHVLAHGRRGAEQLQILGRGAELPPEAPVHALLSALSRSAAVILEVCDASAPDASPWEDLAHRCLQAGAPVVLASRRPALVEVLSAFVDGLYQALHHDIGWTEAVGIGHEAVARLPLGLPTARWWTLLEHRAGQRDGEPLLLDRGPLGGLPALHEDVLALLRAARALAEADGAGFLGLEHLGLAAVGAPRLAGRSGPLVSSLSAAATSLRAAIQASGPRETGRVGRTPRLDALLRALPPDADLDALWRAALSCGGPLDSLAPALTLPADDRTVGSTVGAALRATSAPSLALADGLELVGGPEDGRRLALATGQTLGRRSEHGEQPDVPILADNRVSRLHLRWEGPGRVWLRHGGVRTRDGQREPVPAGELRLVVGDLLQLGRAPAPLLRAVEGA